MAHGGGVGDEPGRRQAAPPDACFNSHKSICARGTQPEGCLSLERQYCFYNVSVWEGAYLNLLIPWAYIFDKILQLKAVLGIIIIIFLVG